MPELTREEKLKIFSQLSPRLQEVLFSDATVDIIDRIGKKYGLDDDKISLLAGITGDVILGITPITSLAQEINSKIISDPQAAMNLAQELYSELLASVMAAPAPAPAAPKTTSPTPPYQGGEKGEVVDRYRESTMAGPEVVDLRNQPKVGPLTFTRPIEPVKPVSPAPAIPAPQPLTPKPVITAPTPLIEAEPHKSSEPVSGPRPQYIIRPSGVPPIDRPDNILDLRKDRGEF